MYRNDTGTCSCNSEVHPMTKKQKAYLKDLCKYHKIEFNDAMEQMTMSEASRWIDKTILQYGRMKRFNRSDFDE